MKLSALPLPHRVTLVALTILAPMGGLTAQSDQPFNEKVAVLKASQTPRSGYYILDQKKFDPPSFSRLSLKKNGSVLLYGPSFPLAVLNQIIADIQQYSPQFSIPAQLKKPSETDSHWQFSLKITQKGMVVLLAQAELALTGVDPATKSSTVLNYSAEKVFAQMKKEYPDLSRKELVAGKWEQTYKDNVVLSVQKGLSTFLLFAPFKKTQGKSNTLAGEYERTRLSRYNAPFLPGNRAENSVIRQSLLLTPEGQYLLVTQKIVYPTTKKGKKSSVFTREKGLYTNIAPKHLYLVSYNGGLYLPSKQDTFIRN